MNTKTCVLGIWRYRLKHRQNRLIKSSRNTENAKRCASLSMALPNKSMQKNWETSLILIKNNTAKKSSKYFRKFTQTIHERSIDIATILFLKNQYQRSERHFKANTMLSSINIPKAIIPPFLINFHHCSHKLQQRAKRIHHYHFSAEGHTSITKHSINKRWKITCMFLTTWKAASRAFMSNNNKEGSSISAML